MSLTVPGSLPSTRRAAENWVIVSRSFAVVLPCRTVGGAVRSRGAGHVPVGPDLDPVDVDAGRELAGRVEGDGTPGAQSGQHAPAAVQREAGCPRADEGVRTLGRRVAHGQPGQLFGERPGQLRGGADQVGQQGAQLPAVGSEVGQQGVASAGVPTGARQAFSVIEPHLMDAFAAEVIAGIEAR
jgi:hypothetical protein